MIETKRTNKHSPPPVHLEPPDGLPLEQPLQRLVAQHLRFLPRVEQLLLVDVLPHQARHRVLPESLADVMPAGGQEGEQLGGRPAGELAPLDGGARRVAGVVVGSEILMVCKRGTQRFQIWTRRALDTFKTMGTCLRQRVDKICSSRLRATILWASA